MNKRRLLKLADLLEADAKNKKGIKFDLALWGASEDGKASSISCGTTACAMGLAVLSGAFRRAGLSNFHGPDAPVITPQMPGDMLGMEAAESLFGITNEEACFLFLDDNYPRSKTSGAGGERYVAKRIRDFVAGRVAP